MNKILLPAVAAAMMAFAGIAFAQMPPVKIGDSASGKVLTTAQGMTLYTFAKDTGGTSACNGPCAVNWPPLTAAADAKPENGYTVITRADGTKQWAYKGKPLYAWKKDQKPGDITGNGLANGAWQIARP